MTAQLTDLALATGSSPARSGVMSAARLINCHVEQIGKQGKHPWIIQASWGYRPFSVLEFGSDLRAAIVVDNSLYVVSGRNVYIVDQFGTSQLLGTLAVDGLVTMAANRRQPVPQIAIVCNGLYYRVMGTDFVQVSDADLPPPVAVFERDGYFLFIIEDGRVFFSGLNASTVDALDFFSAESRSDTNVMGATRGKDNIIFGKSTMEFWVNIGDSDTVFDRQQSANIGCYAAGSVRETTAVINNTTVDTIIWAATDKQGAYNGVMLLNGYAGMKISNEAVDRAIRDEPVPTSIRSMARSDGTHVFYTITGSTFSWEYDTTNGEWCERKSYGLNRWRVQTYALYNGMHIVGDYETGTLYELRPDVYDEAGEHLVMVVQTPPVHAFPYKLQFHALHLDATTGVGINSEQAELDNPQVVIDWSDDGGATWSQQRWASLKRDGDRTRIQPVRKMGAGRSRTYRFTASAAVIREIANAKIEFETLNAA